ncbi:MAG: nitrate transporter permease [Verrucomicrobiaceae bacterium]|nr:nitrate transporter permease [Verrucomicrobiaceae bacterium]
MVISTTSSRFAQMRELKLGTIASNLLRDLGLPLLGIAIFLLVWQGAASQVHTSLGQFPGPAQVLVQAKGLYAEYREDQEREAAFYVRQNKRNADRLAEDPKFVADAIRPYTGKPTFFKQIGTSLKTVFTGFLLASLIAIPVGIAIGLSGNLYSAINPLIQLFKPISPLAWLPLVTIVVSALYATEDGGVPKSYITSSITVMMCSLWPTLLNTAVGVTSVSSDLVNVSRVLRLNWLRHVRSIVLPASVPMIFTGLRLSLSTAWMVLIAAEMLAQNPGLGKFVWDEFQNGSSDSLGRIMVAVLTIGFIGYVLDRCMLQCQRWVSWDKQAVQR